jgi:hypothetical protein
MITMPAGPIAATPAEPEWPLPANNITANTSKPAVANATSIIRRGVIADISQPVRGGHQIPGKRRSLVNTLKVNTLKYAECGRSNFDTAPEFRKSG